MRGEFTHLDNEIQISFVHAHLSQISFSNFSTDVKFSLSSFHFGSGLLTSNNAIKALQGYTEFCLNIEQDRHFTVKKFLETHETESSFDKMASFLPTV